jgi:hypothetical protein
MGKQQLVGLSIVHPRSPDMSLDDIKRRFVDEIKLRAYDDKYVDSNEEREILQVAIQQGISIDSARNALAQVCEMNGYVLESSIKRMIKQDLEAAAGDDGRIDEKEFNTIFLKAKNQMAGKKNDNQIKKMIVELMEDTGNTKVKTGWFSNWYTALKKDLGMA